MAPVLLRYLLRITRHGLYGGSSHRILWTSGHTPAPVADCCRDDPVLWRMVLRPAGQSRIRSDSAREGVREVRVERERELRRRRKRREKARKERRKAALMKAGKWPLTPTKV
jgi:hypothetical protein